MGQVHQAERVRERVPGEGVPPREPKMKKKQKTNGKGRKERRTVAERQTRTGTVLHVFSGIG